MSANRTILCIVLGVVVSAAVGAAEKKDTPADRRIPGKGSSNVTGPAKPSAVPVLSPYRYDLDFSTYFGGSDGEYLRGMDVDAQGNIYVAGTLSGDGPTTPGVYQRKGGRGWVAKFSPTGALLWSTHFGDDACTLFSVKVDRAGFVYVSGNHGPGLPVTAGVFQPAYGGTGNSTKQSGFVAKLKPDASGLVWASYLGNGYQSKYAGDPGFGSAPNGGQFPVGWGNGDCWVMKFRPLIRPGNTSKSVPQ